jgi:ketosteroid isomerase-like protein
MKTFAVLLSLAAAIGCTAKQPVAGYQPQVEAQIKQMLNQAAADWTANNLDGFMDSYANSPQLRFAHPKGITLGYDTVKERYANSIAKSDLSFSDLDVTVLSPDAAVAFGRFHNQGKDGSYATGLFTLMVRKIEGRWKIIHDHSSDLPADYPR